MSWIFGTNKKTSEEVHEKETSKLGFDPEQVSNVSNIISSGTSFDASRLHPLAGLEKGVEYLDLEEEQLSAIEGSQGLIPSRGWSDDLCYGTGAVYLLGLGTGGAYGFIEGVRNITPGSPGKLKLNTILNHITKRGPFMGNSAGVLALTYNIINSTIDSVRGKHDASGAIVAGAVTGAIFKSSKGFKPMAYASGLTAGAAALWSGVKGSVLE
ncbi:hypothetical protein TPHA_0H02200 [Tetrapisispora phaffii CBS 4417]|uniref:Mitochondrial import inner membrane translocase subunit TIM23 n=1 Tax=Tetrapisispora phaffii (strain ATCC 24235 / CBS 4417 / NBRC 1672 / NRRL Y-8282 / UCD 70-5) TaxID=1071381 RepID=G8BWH3_TETPH|nr:hypothetical protein TPHA_0H02200 [Tetrapisispora phaffii CBS 4417]CCE64424.1 hypothetical protein TPHA_0H02200 [Tetrapisispora phaffii CBS 4417]